MDMEFLETYFRLYNRASSEHYLCQNRHQNQFRTVKGPEFLKTEAPNFSSETD